MHSFLARGSSAACSFARAALLALALAATAAPGFAFAPTVLADVGPFANAAVGALPGGGYLLVWRDSRNGQIKAQRISAAGFPGRVEILSASLDAVTSVVVMESGAWVAFGIEGAGADQVGVGAVFFDAQDRFVRHVSYPDPIPDPGGLVISEAPRAVALPGSGFLVAFEVGIQADPLRDPLQPSDTDVYLMKLDADGQRVDAVRVNEQTAGFQFPTGIGLSASGVVVSWGSRVPDAAEQGEVRARVFTPDLVPVSGEIRVNDVATAAADQEGSRLAVGADGRFLVVWQEVESDGSAGIRVRAFGPTGSPLGGERAADPEEPGDQGAPDIAVTKEGVVWVSWVTVGVPPADGSPAEAAIVVRPFGFDAEPEGDAREVATGAFGSPSLTGGTGGALVIWQAGSEGSLLVGSVVGPAGQAGTPPDASLALEGPGLPGFRVWVRVAPTPAESRWGTRVEPCLAEALCAAGALPDRAEVIVRVAGPKPNGFLWPSLVKLTTSQVEVWLQQKASGAVQYYLLPGASPGSGLLPGLFDRNGFRP
jgi:hypothetical protein